MAERLTDKDYFAWHYRCGYQNKKDSLERTQKEHKLGKLEDILEEYGIESLEELDKKIGHYIDKIDLEAENDYLKKTIEKQNVVTQSISKDRDTWKRACELACKHIAEVEWLSCPETDDISESENEIKTLTKQSLNYFYQQAKKEGNDDK